MLDDTDVKIINSILLNSRRAVTEIAKEVGISNVAIQQRIQKLEKKGIISAYTAKLDYKKLGYTTIAFVGIFLNQAKFYRDVIKDLNGFSNIILLVHVDVMHYNTFLIICLCFCFIPCIDYH